MSKKLCPLRMIGASGANPRGSMDCIGEDCQMWCKGDDGPGWHIVAMNGIPCGYRSGCGLMPKENRKL